jgi:pyrimidine operon attenuation protein/uracil phosphoribosyltransferase
MVERRELLDASGVAAALDALAEAILTAAPPDLALVGIRTGGLHLAERLRGRIAARTGVTAPLGAVDIALYRDDLEGLPRPAIGPTELPFMLPGKTIVLVDDVLFTGRSVRAALDALIDYGRPRAVRLAVLVDRGHRELPIQADYVGLRVETDHDDQVRVQLTERGEPDRVVLRTKAGAA